MDIEPAVYTLAELIERLDREDPARVVPIGFADPHSYRGFYDELAFSLRRGITAGEMAAAARSALRRTFQGWKGGDYTMCEWTACWLVTGPGECGESIGHLLLELMLGGAQ
jgi:hypothetical protein